MSQTPNHIMSRIFIFALGLFCLIAFSGCRSSEAQAVCAATIVARSTGRDMSEYQWPNVKYIQKKSPVWIVWFNQKGIPTPDGDIVVLVDASSGKACISHP